MAGTDSTENHEKFDYEEEEEDDDDYEDMSDDEDMAASYNILSEANESLKRANENMERHLAAEKVVVKLKEHIALQDEMIARIKKEIAVVVEQTACSKKRTAWCMEQIAKRNQDIARRDKRIAEFREQLKRKIIRVTLESSVMWIRGTRSGGVILDAAFIYIYFFHFFLIQCRKV
ncbi:uncharacterized protein LOC131310245 isoform X1 [Rhododendron vialii]|uniref:uncharacterized protein LOC131310245 isoform X1 n=1 Tax=Rhododendron vialii TaxID=182163 RepID=UPI00265D966C|nr:uncharacterized protein LOC131310245 isoform X1 [Rhododendron vialii]